MKQAAVSAPRLPVPGGMWVDLLPGTYAKVENAYFRDGAPRTGLEGYIGTQTARFVTDKQRGLRLITTSAAIPLSGGQVAADNLVRSGERNYRFYRYYYAIAFKRNGDSSGAVLLGANSLTELDKLGTQLLADPDTVCGPGSAHCSVFPKTCTVTLEADLEVNGAKRTVYWPAFLGNVAPPGKVVEVLRDGQAPRKLDPNIQADLRYALLSGDKVRWE